MREPPGIRSARGPPVEAPPDARAGLAWAWTIFAPPAGDFGGAELVQDALSVIRDSGAKSVVPVATAHGGWEAIELRRNLGDRIPKIVFVDWIVTEAPPPFLTGLAAMKNPAQALAVRDSLFAMWTAGVTDPEVLRFVREDMGSFGAEMWARAGREIEAAYAREGSPLKALAGLESPVKALHLYCQPADPGYLAVQEEFAHTHDWFSVRRLDGRSHFPTVEIPDAMAQAIKRFVSA